MKNVRLNYLKGTEWKVFFNREAFIEWAKDESHDGMYYVSTPRLTFKFTRKQLLEVYGEKKTK